MRVALVHDYLTQLGGAERVLKVLMDVFPHAPVFTLLNSGLPGFESKRIRTSFLQRLPGARQHHRYFPLLMPLAAEQFDFREYDVVFSATHSFGKGVITGPNTLHISYCFTPTRYVWDDSHRYVREFSRSRFFQRLAPVGLSYIRLWDYFASQRVDKYITLSKYVAERIGKYYHREANVIPPPVNVDRFNVQKDHKDYYLIVSRLVPYKRIDVAIEACEKLGRKLLIAGTGPEELELKKRAGKYAQFLGFVSDDELPRLYQGARAFLFPQEEDFGITPLEAAASGKPTIAFGAGGALETVQDGKTGLFFREQTADSLAKAIQEFEKRSFDPQAIRAHAEQYRASAFMAKIEELVHNEWLDFKQKSHE